MLVDGDPGTKEVIGSIVSKLETLLNSVAIGGSDFCSGVVRTVIVEVNCQFKDF